MTVSNNLKVQVSKVLAEEFPYDRPTVDQVLGCLDYRDEPFLDEDALIEYITADLKTQSFMSDFVEVHYIAD